MVSTPFLQGVVEELYPGLADKHFAILRGIDGFYLALCFQTPVGLEAGTDVLVQERARINAHQYFFQSLVVAVAVSVYIEAGHKIHKVCGDFLQVPIGERCFLYEFFVVIGHVNVDASEAKHESFEVGVAVVVGTVVVSSTCTSSSGQLLDACSNIVLVLVSFSAQTLGAGRFVLVDLDPTGRL